MRRNEHASDCRNAHMIQITHTPPACTHVPLGNALIATPLVPSLPLGRTRPPGLEVFIPETRSWLPIPPEDGAITINCGEMLAYQSDGLLKSNLHRVKTPQPGEEGASLRARYSIAFFANVSKGQCRRPCMQEHMCMCSCPRTHAHVHWHARTYTRAHTRARARARSHTHTHTHTHAHTHSRTHARTHTHTHIPVYTHTSVRTSTHTHTHTHARTHTRTHARGARTHATRRTHARAHARTHARRHARTHAYVCARAHFGS